MKKENMDYNILEKIKYKIYNPGGNVTALISGNEYTQKEKYLINKMIMKKHPKVEQVGFLSKKTNRLEMAGGEFCLNATRCAVYEYTRINKDKIKISVSGTNKELTGKIISDNIVEIKQDINKNLNQIIDVTEDITYVKIEGILIAIFDEEKSKVYIKKLKENEEIAKNEIKQLMINKIQTKEKAIGIMFLEKISNQIKINPVVWVKEIDTVFYETACGSGSLGTAIYNYFKNKEDSTKIIQPSGYSINIKLSVKENIIQNALISGIVREENYGSKRNIKRFSKI